MAKLFLGGIAPTVTKEDIEAHFGQYGIITDAVVMYKDGKPRGFGFVTFELEESVDVVLSEPQVIHDREIDVKRADGQGPGKGQDKGKGGGKFDRGPSYGGGGPAFGGPAFGAPRSMGSKGGPPWAKGGCPKGGYGGFGGGCAKGGGGGGSSGAACKVFVGGLPPTCDDDMLTDYFGRYGTLVDVVVMKDKHSQKSRGFGFVKYDCTDPVDSVMAEYSSHEIDGKWIEVKRAVPQESMAAPMPSVTRSAPMGIKGAYGGGKGPGPSFYDYNMALPALGGGFQPFARGPPAFAMHPSGKGRRFGPY